MTILRIRRPGRSLCLRLLFFEYQSKIIAGFNPYFINISSFINAIFYATFSNLSPDSSVSLFDANKTYILIGVLALIGCIPVYAIIM